MDNVFIINPSASLFEIKDSIHAKLIKVRSIISCLFIAIHNNEDSAIRTETINEVLLVAEDYLEELDVLQTALDKMVPLN